MLIHAYLTNGFLKMAKIFLLSLYATNKNNVPYVWLDTRGLTLDECVDLRACYPKGRLHIVNKPVPMENWAMRANVSVQELETYKHQCEQQFVTNKNKVWKLMTAGDDRVNALSNVIWGKQDLPEWEITPKFFAHFDIDTLFRKPLTEFHGMMEKADIWLKLRVGHPTVKARITIDMLLLNGADNVRTFFNHWIYHINRVDPPNRPIGFGQTSCWLAFEEMESYLNYKVLPLKYGLPGRNNVDDIVWTGNVHKLKKKDCVELFNKELSKWSA